VEGKALPILSAVGFFLVLPLLIVLAMLATSLGSIGNAADCRPTETGGKAFGWPTEKHDPVQGWDDNGPDVHLGLDYDVAEGKPVLAAEDGKVVSTSGEWIKIEHADGVETWYQFFQTKSVRVGATVTRGQQIGTSGTGTEAVPGKSGAHLHFELRIREGETSGPLTPQDPTDEIGEDAQTSTASGCGCGGGGGPLVGGNNQEKAFNFFVQNGYTQQQAAGVVGNMIHESQVEPTLKNGDAPGTVTHTAEAAGGDLAWGIVQWYKPSKMINPSRQAGIDDATIETLAYQLEFLRKQLDGTGAAAEKAAGDALRAARTVDDAAFAFAFKFERFTTNPNDPEFGDRKATAREVLETYGDGTAAGEAGEAGAAGACTGIVATAAALAWHSPGRHDGVAKTLATDAYQQAMGQYTNISDNDQNPYTDCGVFVATVMRMSGADPDYPARSTPVQEEYLRTSGKYEVFDDINDLDQLQPGDIMIGPGHTFLYIGPQEGDDGNTYAAASASWNGHPPEFEPAYINDNGKHFAAARLKK